MMFRPERCVDVIVATAILHNICIRLGISALSGPSSTPSVSFPHAYTRSVAFLST